MSKFFDLLAAGTRSLSFEQKRTPIDFEYKPYESKVVLRTPRKPRTPQEIMDNAWKEVGRAMWDAIGVIEREYGQQISQSK
ncbi:MAG: hypothetical protein LBC85_00040 [Fibromonadaceae bacterium]|nr:hypothetical protein [Fibromonadaceae bacterium]